MASTISVDTIQGSTAAGKVIMPTGGHVIQTQYMQSGLSYQEISSTSMTEVTGFNVTITPKFTTSKIKITSQISWWLTSDANNYMFLTYYRDIGGGGYSNLASVSPYYALHFYAPGRNSGWNSTSHLIYIDQPASTSAVTYKLYSRHYDATNNIRLKYNQTMSLMTAEEIAA